MDTDPAMLSVTYSPPVGRVRNGLTGYMIRYTRVGSDVSQTVNVHRGPRYGLRTSVITGLVAFTNYSVEMSAMNVNGTGPFSDVVFGISGQDGIFLLSCYYTVCVCMCKSFMVSAMHTCNVSINR